MGDQLHRPSEVAEELGVDTDAIYEWIRTGELEAQDLGRGSVPRWRIARSAIEAFKRKRARGFPRDVTTAIHGEDRRTSAIR